MAHKINSGDKFGLLDWLIAGITVLSFVCSQMLFDIATWLMSYNYFICADRLDKIHSREQ